ncbi:MAG: LPS-assembly protein LptD [Deltaproteobacteria bacterium]|nr:LPS-assembly protein LptD [Deltaproteobacteria bacterium]
MMGHGIFYVAFAGTMTLAQTVSAQSGLKLFKEKSGDLEIEADSLVYNDRRGTVVATGNLKLERGGTVLFAERLEIERARGEAVASGDVRIVERDTIIYADRVRIPLSGAWGEGTNATIYVKSGVSNEALRGLGPWSVKSVGRTTMKLTAARITRLSDERLVLDGATLTPCDCGPDEPPSFGFRARRAVVNPDEGATLEAPTLQIRDSPIIGFPASYVPFGRRRTGFLMPRAAWSPRDGWMFGDDFFIATSRSTDVTLSFDYFKERGPRGGAEFRYAFTDRDRGRLQGSVIRDAFADNDARFAIDFSHRQSLAPTIELLAKAEVIGDTHHLNDFGYAIRDRNAEFTRSFTEIAWTPETFRLALLGDFFQDLRGGTAAKFPLTDENAIAPSRLPRAELTFFPTRLVGPLTIRGAAEVLHATKPGPAFVDANANGTRDANETVSQWQRVFATLTLGAPFSLGPVDVSVAATYAQAASFADIDGFPATQSNVAITGHVETELTRTLGPFRHHVIPTLSYLYTPVNALRAGPAGNAAADDRDWLASIHRAAFGLRNRFSATSAAGLTFSFETHLAQSIDLAAESLGNFRSQNRFRIASGATAVEWKIESAFHVTTKSADLAEQSFTFSANVWRFGLGLSYLYMLTGERERFVYDDLFSPLSLPLRAPLPASSTFNELSGRLDITLARGLSVYGLIHYSFIAEVFLEIAGGFSYRSPCNCWSVNAFALKRTGVTYPDIFFTFDLALLGSGGVTYLQQ